MKDKTHNQIICLITSTLHAGRLQLTSTDSDSGRLQSTLDDFDRLWTTPNDSEWLRTIPDDSGRFRTTSTPEGYKWFSFVRTNNCRSRIGVVGTLQKAHHYHQPLSVVCNYCNDGILYNGIKILLTLTVVVLCYCMFYIEFCVYFMGTNETI